MAKKPNNFQWLGFTDEQIRLLDFIDHFGNNSWTRNAQTEKLMPKILSDCADAGLNVDQVIEAMRSIGYDDRALHMLTRWESKRTTGKFGK